jgi:hypothetical protein
MNMKSTAERLSEVFTVPETNGECQSVGIGSDNIGTEVCMGWKGVLVRYIDAGRSKIPFPQFIDLLHDRIAPWRLEENGFSSYPSTGCYGITINDVIGVYIMFKFGDVELWVNGECLPMTGITTYTDLITLIRLIG